MTVWTSPRDTVRRIIAENPRLHVVLLVCLSGIDETLDRASMRSLGDRASLGAILGMACLIGPWAGLLSLWISSHLIRLTGGWLGGTGSREHLKTALAWATVPVVFALPLWIPNLLLFGPDMFTDEMPRLDARPLLLIPLIAVSVAEATLGIWSVVLLCNTVAEVQGFRSAWRGLGNILLAFAVIIVPGLLLVIVILFFAGSSTP